MIKLFEIIKNTKVMNQMFLTWQELVELTGYKLASKQIVWLQSRGYFVETNAQRKPRITHTQIEEMRRFNTPAYLHLNRPNNAVSNDNLESQSSFIQKDEPNLHNLLVKINKK